MMEVTLIANGLDLSKRLSTYQVTKEITYKKVVTTLDDTEHPYPGAKKDVITFSLLPMTDEEGGEVYDVLYSLIFNATYTAQYAGGLNVTKRVRVTSDLESTFLLLSVDGKRRYRGGSIQLRAL